MRTNGFFAWLLVLVLVLSPVVALAFSTSYDIPHSDNGTYDRVRASALSDLEVKASSGGGWQTSSRGCNGGDLLECRIDDGYFLIKNNGLGQNFRCRLYFKDVGEASYGLERTDVKDSQAWTYDGTFQDWEMTGSASSTKIQVGNTAGSAWLKWEFQTREHPSGSWGNTQQMLTEITVSTGSGCE